MNMMVNPDKFQAMIISCDKKNKRNLNINNSIFSSVICYTFRYRNKQIQFFKCFNHLQKRK